MLPNYRIGSFACAAVLSAALAQARPILIEEAQVIQPPSADTYPSFGIEVATNGEQAIIASFDYRNGEFWKYYALEYRKVNGLWTFGTVIDHYEKYYDSYSYPIEIAMRGDRAIVNLGGGGHVFNRVSGAWQPGGPLNVNTTDLELEGSRAVYSHGYNWGAAVVDFNPDGTRTVTDLPGQPAQGDDENWGGPVDLSGDRVIIGTPRVQDLEPKEIPIYQRVGSAWQLLGKLQEPAEAPLGGPVALRVDDAIVDAGGGPFVWRLPDISAPVDRLRAVDAWSFGPTENLRDIEKSGDKVFVQSFSSDRRAYVINVFQAGGDVRYSQVATLAAKNGADLIGSFDIVGNTVLASGADQAVHAFELPTSFATPAPAYENFENGAGSWTPQAGAQFAVVTVNGNRVYRQTSLVGDARALLAGWSSRDQGIEADIRPTAFSTNDRWVGLITRYANASNFVYVTLRNSGTVQLRRLVNGTIRELARAPLAVSVNRNYRVRLESVASRHRVYVDGQLMLDVVDSGTLQAGSAGIAMYQASADYDNVILTPSPHTTIFAQDFSDPFAAPWQLSGSGNWQSSSGGYAQSSTSGDARAVIGTPLDDQIVEARVKPVSYAAPSGTQERWTGILARYRDTQNYYYLTLRSSNTLSLRKVVNGAITPLASAPLTVTPGTIYRLRLEAVGTQLRAYVDGRQVLQANDSSLPSGSGGLVTYKASALYDDYVAYQP